MTQTQRTPVAGTSAEDIPVPGQFDEEIEHWELEAVGPGKRPMVLTIPIRLQGDTLRAIVEEANAEGMDAQQFLQREVSRLGKTLRARLRPR